VHLKEAANGQTYAQVSTQSLANPTNQKPAQETQILFRGDALRELLLNAWGWGLVGTVALILGWILIALGVVLLVLPLLKLAVNGAAAAGTAASARS